MQKKKIAVIFGGNSTEYEVSLQSAFSVFENINKEKFDIVPIGITRNGDWYHYTGKKEKIANNTWFEDNENLYSVAVSQNRSVKGFIEFSLEEYAEFIKNYRDNSRLIFTAVCETEIEIYYVPANNNETTINIEENYVNQISGNNIDGFIVTVWRKNNEQELYGH